MSQSRSWRTMDAEIDHYVVLGLPSGEEGSKLTEKEIVKAYKSKAFELHPDKRPDDPNAASNFQLLQTSYGILRDDKARKLFDDHLRVKRDHQRRLSQRDGKRRKMVSDLEQRERDASAPDPSVKEREKEARIARQFKEEIAMIRAMHAKKVQLPDASAKKKGRVGAKGGGGGVGIGVNKENVLKVSWEKFGEVYSSHKLRELFSKFGEVEDVVMKVGKKRGSALVVMATKEGAVAATGSVIGHLANPLLVLPLKPAMPADSFKPAMPAEVQLPDASAKKKRRVGASGGGGGVGIGVNKENVLKVSWEKFGEVYSSNKLRELFSKFGEVEDVVMKVGKKRGSALVVMATKEGAVAATGSVIGHLANPLLVLPHKPAMPADSHKPAMPADSSGAPKSLEEFQAFEDYVLKKLQKAAEKQR